MPRFQFGLSSYRRARGDLPHMPVINMYAEEAPTEETGVVLQSRPGLVDRGANMGPGPVQALFRKDNVLDGGLFGISGDGLWEEGTGIWELAISGPVSMDGYADTLFIAGGGILYAYDGSTVIEVPFPDDANVIKVLVAASRAVAIREDTGTFYWSGSLTSGFDPLDFATAEGQPDNLLDALFIDDTLVLFGAETVEFWANTSDEELPFQPIEQRTFEKGIRATGCAAIFDSSFVWVGNDNVVYANGQAPTAISDPGLNKQIADSAECSLFSFTIDGIEFLALRLDDETHVYGGKSGLWSEFKSYNQPNWIPQCHASGVFGSSIDGRTLAWGAGHTDLGGVLERRFRGGFAINSGGVTVNNVVLRTNPGRTPFLEGPYAEPKVEMCISRDAGETWGDWKPRSLGRQGEYRKKLRWGPQGMASQPGFMAEWRVTDPVDWRVSEVLANEKTGGR